ncbi:MMPL family transporter [Sulfurimonas sp.]|uniref:efflux RND transporter permease subunit n=1 Tax=Sulfurimonas sp. TaxID=2022749 RepID=UPI00260E9541|nr:MMPL family transporter [Sulfurimonas sp.]
MSKDAKITMIAISLSEKIGSDESVNIAVFNKLQELLKEETKRSGYKFYLSGIPAVTASLVTVSQNDAMVLMPLAVVVVVLFLFLIFRSVLGVLIPSVVIVFTFLTVLSIQILLGYKLNNFTVNIPSFITAIAIADAMHLYLAWIYYKLGGKKTKEALTEALRSNITPMALTSFTTAVGFATLGLSAIEPIATLGIAITSGAVLAFILTITIVPAILLTLGGNYKITPVKIINLTHIKGYGAFIKRNDKKIVVTFFVLIVLVSLGIFNLKVDSNSIKYFTKDTVVRSGADFVEKNLTGSMRYEIIVDSQKREGVKNPKFLESIAAFENVLKKHFDNVRFTTSLKDIVVRMQKVLNPDANSSLPQDKNLVAQYLLLYSMSLPQGMELNDKMDTQERYLRLTINTNIVDTSKDLVMIQWIKNYFNIKTPYSADVQGQTGIFAYMQSSVTDTLIVSISMTLLIVTLSMLLIFKNLKMLWLFLIPNIAPIIIVGGVMGLLGISVDIGIAISAAVILGIAVDDTIHFFSKYYESIKVRGFEESIDYIINHSGNAMILTTLILSLTFALFGVSSFVPNVNFAIVTVSALNIALLFDLVLLPSLLSLLLKE